MIFAWLLTSEGPTASGAGNISVSKFLLLSLCTAQPPRIYTCRGYSITMFIGLDSSLSLGKLSDEFNKLLFVWSNKLLDTLCFCCIRSDDLLSAYTHRRDCKDGAKSLFTLVYCALNAD